jgi:hypothetical protein
MQAANVRHKHTHTHTHKYEYLYMYVILRLHKFCHCNWMFKLKFVSFKYNQQDATLYSILYYCQCSTCFRRLLRPSSGAQNCTHSICYMSSLLAATASVGAYSSRGVLPTVLRRCVCSRNPVTEEALVHWGLLRPKNHISLHAVKCSSKGPASYISSLHRV